MIDVNSLRSYEEADDAIKAATDDDDVSLEQFDALLARRTQLLRSGQRSNKAVGELKTWLRDAERREAEARAQAASAPTDEQRQEAVTAAAVARLQVEEAERRLPFADMTDEELEQQIEDAQEEEEILREKLQDMSPGIRKTRAEREVREAFGRAFQLGAELKRRENEARATVVFEDWADKETSKRLRREDDDTLKAILSHQEFAQWEKDRARSLYRRKWLLPPDHEEFVPENPERYRATRAQVEAKIAEQRKRGLETFALTGKIASDASEDWWRP